MNTIGERIKHLRMNHKPKKLSLKSLGDMIGVSHAAVHMWESGESKSPTPENVLALADIFNCDIRWLITGKKPEYQAKPEQTPGEVNDLEVFDVYTAKIESIRIIQEMNEEFAKIVLPYLKFQQYSHLNKPKN